MPFPVTSDCFWCWLYLSRQWKSACLCSFPPFWFCPEESYHQYGNIPCTLYWSVRLTQDDLTSVSWGGHTTLVWPPPVKLGRDESVMVSRFWAAEIAQHTQSQGDGGDGRCGGAFWSPCHTKGEAGWHSRALKQEEVGAVVWFWVPPKKASRAACWDCTALTWWHILPL